MPNNYMTEDYEALRRFALALKELQVTDDLPIDTFLSYFEQWKTNGADGVINSTEVPAEIAGNADWVGLLDKTYHIWVNTFEQKGYAFDEWVADVKAATQEDLDEF